MELGPGFARRLILYDKLYWDWVIGLRREKRLEPSDLVRDFESGAGRRIWPIWRRTPQRVTRRHNEVEPRRLAAPTPSAHWFVPEARKDYVMGPLEYARSAGSARPQPLKILGPEKTLVPLRVARMLEPVMADANDDRCSPETARTTPARHCHRVGTCRAPRAHPTANCRSCRCRACDRALTRWPLRSGCLPAALPELAARSGAAQDQRPMLISFEQKPNFWNCALVNGEAP